MDKDSLDEDENDSGIATSPANAGASFPASSASNSETNGDNTVADIASRICFYHWASAKKGQILYGN
ncbi:hypothetical protein DOY81_013271 [Sarcophaga bullata]|nr:hypothetical protein DOY81_013271 [Sarcophaga bullata]